MKIALGLLLLGLLAVTVAGDGPGHCLEEQILGEWVIYSHPDVRPAGYNCAADYDTEHHKLAPVVLGPDGTLPYASDPRSHWTLIYDEAIEIVSYDKELEGRMLVNFPPNQCRGTSPGFGRKNEVAGPEVLCVLALSASSYDDLPETIVPSSFLHPEDKPEVDVAQASKDAFAAPWDQESYVAALNAGNDLTWTAGVYPEGLLADVKAALVKQGPVPAELISAAGFPVSSEAPAETVPEAWNWCETPDGANYCGPILNQGRCGSCYSFASVGALEKRFRIKGTEVALSNQAVVSCSLYAEGCDGGFPYKVYAWIHDFGLPTEAEFPYTAGSGSVEACKATTNSYFVSDYGYMGGFYGGATEGNMMAELADNGPMAVGFMVEPDFLQYKGGVYRHTGIVPAELESVEWVEINHGVTLVGYGEEDGTPYWLCANSWGDTWGMAGFFKIFRGANEVGIESCVSSAVPVV